MRVQTQLGPADYDLFRRLVNTLAAVTSILNSHRAMLARLKRLFGLSKSERSRDLLRGQDADVDAAPQCDDSGAAASDSDSDEQTAATSPGREKRKGHGRLPVSMYEAATHIAVQHQSLQVGGCCPHCRSGKLYELKEPAQYLRIFGQPVFAGTCWNCQRLRCSSCGSVHTARAPAEAQGPKFDETAVAMLALSRYSLGLPLNRIERMQQHMRLPVPSSTQWDVLHDNAPAFEPVFAELERQGAQGEVVHNDDTYARLLAFMGERRAKLLQAADFPDPERVGMFTTAIVSITNEQSIVLFYTGRKYAGENLAALLEARAEELEPPTLMCDGLDSRNLPAGHAVDASSCIAHARRGIVDQVVNFPRECRHVLDELRKVYRVDAECKKARLSPASGSPRISSTASPSWMAQAWLQAELDDKRAEPKLRPRQGLQVHAQALGQADLVPAKAGRAARQQHLRENLEDGDPPSTKLALLPQRAGSRDRRHVHVAHPHHRATRREPLRLLDRRPAQRGCSRRQPW